VPEDLVIIRGFFALGASLHNQAAASGPMLDNDKPHSAGISIFARPVERFSLHSARDVTP